ncbi:MAG TPA: hypothetical protein VJ994_08970 [Paracoccaceae bacterium]|nr:hypothetical protein [Paracoccaceae bacterium]
MRIPRILAPLFAALLLAGCAGMSAPSGDTAHGITGSGLRCGACEP